MLITAWARLVNISDNISSQVQSEITYSSIMFLRSISQIMCKTSYLVRKAYPSPARSIFKVVSSRLSPIKSLEIGDLKTGGPPFKNKDFVK